LRRQIRAVTLSSVEHLYFGEAHFGERMSGFSLKDQLFNRPKIEYLAKQFAAHDPTFPDQRFVRSVMNELGALELKQRISLIAEKLEDHLPRDFPDALRHILGALPPPLDESKTDDDFGDFIFAPLGEFIVRNGLKPKLLGLSLRALKAITKRFSMEDALRAFLREFPEQTLAELMEWTKDSNYHVRRLVSESTRPLLPWSGRIHLPVESTLPILDTLHVDPTRYVTRSVANHLNDISKSTPDLVVQTLEKWRERGEQEPSELMWITRHSLRTLIKRGHRGSLKLLGFNPNPKISVGEIHIAKSMLVPGESLEFSFDISALRNESLVIDFVIEFVKAQGKRSSKVFKAGKVLLKKDQTITVRKCHKLRANATTFQLYPGRHSLTIQINGQKRGSTPFTIV
jgi:3-methyladenine DNA glycosylase AlkC